jgi:hypothetical protein
MSIPPYPCESYELMTNLASIASGYLLLVCRICSKENDLCKTPMWKRSIANTANDLEATLDDSQTFRALVVHKTSNIFSRHFWKLLLKKSFEPCEEDEGVRLHVVFYWNDFYDVFP